MGTNGKTGDTTDGLGDVIRVNSVTIAYSGTLTIAANTNGAAAGPITVGSSTTLQVDGVLVIL